MYYDSRVDELGGILIKINQKDKKISTDWNVKLFKTLSNDRKIISIIDNNKVRNAGY